MTLEVCASRSALRRSYVDELSALCGIRSIPLLRAFRSVPREAFLPAGPWLIEGIDGATFRSPDADPAHILHAVGVVLARGDDQPLHCANPALVGKALQSLGVEPGDRVLHVGAGLGYFSAVIAEMVGAGGKVVAAEIQPVLAEKARENLAGFDNVDVVGDAAALVAQEFDVIFSSAGAARIPALWLDCLAPDGRMMLPLTGSKGAGFTFLIQRSGDGRCFKARLESFVRFYPCIGLRDPGDIAHLDAALADGRGPFVTSLRRDPHEKDERCWLHSEESCLTTAAPDR